MIGAHGASQLAQLALRAMIDQARVVSAESTTDLITTLSAQAEQMAAVRPSMAPLYNLLTRWRAQLEQLHDADLPQARTRRWSWASASSPKLRRRGSCRRPCRRPPDGHRTLITHSYSSTVLKTFLLCAGMMSVPSSLNHGHSTKATKWATTHTVGHRHDADHRCATGFGCG